MPSTLAAVTNRLDSLGLGSAHPKPADPEVVRLRAELLHGHACLLGLSEAADQAQRTLQLAEEKAAEAERLEAQHVAGGDQVRPQATASPQAVPEAAQPANGHAEGQGQPMLAADTGLRATAAEPQAMAADLEERDAHLRAAEAANRAEHERLAARRWQMDLEWEDIAEHQELLAAKGAALEQGTAALQEATTQLAELRQSLLTWASQLAEKQHELDQFQAELKQQKRSQQRGPRGAYHKFAENCPRQQKDIIKEVQCLLELKTKDDVQGACRAQE